MTAICKVCGHADLASINQALVEGVSIRDIAGQYALSKSSVARHKANCIPASLVKAREASQVAQADDLLSQIRDLQQKTLSILDRSTGKDDRLALSAIREARSNIDLLGRLLGELDSAPKTAILIANPEWINTRSAILTALQPYVDARQAVINALQVIGA